MASPTRYIPEQPERDGDDLILKVRVKYADEKSKMRLVDGWPFLIRSWPIKGWLGILRAGSAIAALFE